jgi:glycosyltransferase involved in cell wall biosynthesis
LSDSIELYVYFHERVPEIQELSHRSIIVRAPMWWQAIAGYALSYHFVMPFLAWRDQVDLLCLPNYMLPAVPLCPTAVVLTNDLFHGVRHADGRWKYRIGYGVFGTLARHFADRILTFSEHSRRELVTRHGIAEPRVSVVPPGVDLGRFPSTGKHRARPYLLYVGQMFPRRHIQECVEAFRLLRPEWPDLQFVLVGPDKHVPRLSESLFMEANLALGDPDAVIHYAHVSDAELGDLYRGARLAVYVSSVEAFGLPPFEAFLLGTPAVVAASPLVDELYAGHVFVVRGTLEPRAIAAAIREGLANGPRREAISAAGRAAAVRHSPDAALRCLAALAGRGASRDASRRASPVGPPPRRGNR